MTFQYTGSKQRYLHLLPQPSGRLVVEPFAGSASYSMHSNASSIILAEKNARLREVWSYLHTADQRRLLWLETIKPVGVTCDARDLQKAYGLCDAERDLFMMMCRTMFMGVMHSWHLSPGSRLKVQKRLLPFLESYRKIAALHSDFWHTEQYAHPGATFFVDPPYRNTTSEYAEDDVDLGSVAAFVLSCRRRGASVILTYGNGAPEVFPMFHWLAVAVRTVRGSTRTEWVSV